MNVQLCVLFLSMKQKKHLISGQQFVSENIILVNCGLQ